MCENHTKIQMSLFLDRQKILANLFSPPEKKIFTLKYNEIILPLEENKGLCNRKKFIKKNMAAKIDFTKCIYIYISLKKLIMGWLTSLTFIQNFLKIKMHINN